MIIPPDASVNVQRAFQDLNDRLRSMEGRPVPASQEALLARIESLEAQTARLSSKPSWQDPNDVFPGGQISKETLLHQSVDGGIQHQADGWDARLSSEYMADIYGRYGVRVTAGGGLEGDSSGHRGPIYLDGDVNVAGTAYGNIDASVARTNLLSQGLPISVVFGGSVTAGTNANSGTSETTLPGYVWYFPAILPGDMYMLQGIGTMAANTNTKTLKFYIGTGAAITLQTNAASVTNHVYTFLFFLRYRSSTTVAVHGHYFNGTAAATGTTAAVILNNALATTGANNVPLRAYLTLTGGASSDISITDFTVTPFRGLGGVIV